MLCWKRNSLYDLNIWRSLGYVFYINLSVLVLQHPSNERFPLLYLPQISQKFYSSMRKWPTVVYALHIILRSHHVYQHEGRTRVEGPCSFIKVSVSVQMYLISFENLSGLSFVCPPFQNRSSHCFNTSCQSREQNNIDILRKLANSLSFPINI